MAEGVKVAIKERIQSWMECYATRDWKGLSHFYTDDCNFMPPNGSIVTGRDAICQTVAAFHAGGVDKVVHDTQEIIYSGGDLAAERGIFQLSAADGTMLQQGKYLVVWKRINGKWYVYNDIFNSDTPEPKSLWEEIKERKFQRMYHFKLRNLKDIVDVYTEDCKILPPDAPMIEGRPGATEMFPVIWERGVDYIESQSVEVTPMGENMAMDRGISSAYNKEGIQLNVGKFIQIWRKIDGTWYLAYDAFNNGR